MLKKIVSVTLIVLLIALVIIQFIHPARNMVASKTPQDITVLYPVPGDVNKILAKACYDCHSDNTRYPWYNNMQPVSWWLDDHVRGGKGKLNFSEFGSYDKTKQAKKLRGIVREIKGGGMPLDSYLWIHKDAILTDEEKKTLDTWAIALAQQISPATKADSVKYKL